MPSTPASSHEPDAQALLERSSELDAIDGCLARARGGAGGGLLVEGTPGVGKTMLLREAAERARGLGATVLSARGSELEGEFAWGVVRQLFERLVARAPPEERDALLADAAALAAPALGLGAGDASAPEASFSTLHGLYWLTMSIARRAPLLLVVDDVHWADAPSLRFLAFLVPRLEGLPILTALATRPPASVSPAGADVVARLAADPLVRSMRPAPLSEAASREVVRAKFGDDTADDFCRACHETTGGNPFLLHELVGQLAAEGVAGTAAEADRVRRTTPEVVRRSVLLRLARLPVEAVSLARAAAVLGPNVGLRRACALARVDEDAGAQAARAAIAADVFEDQPGLVFVHPILRAAVLEDLSAPERAGWQDRAARLLAAEGRPADELAPYLLQTTPAASEWVVTVLREGAARATKRAAADVGAAYLRRALEEPPTADARPGVLVELARAEAGQDLALACDHLREALGLLGKRQRHAEVALELGSTLALAGRFPEAADVLERLTGELGDDGSKLAASVEAEFMNAARWELSTRPRTLPIIERLRRLGASGAALDPRLHTQLAIELAVEGRDLDDVIVHSRTALAGSELMAPESTTNLPQAITALMYTDLVDDAQSYAEAWLRTAQAQGWPTVSAIAATVCALVSLHAGAVSDAVAYARQSLSAPTQAWTPPMGVAFLVGGLIARGELDEASAQFVERGWEDDLPPVWPFTVVLFFRGQLHTARGSHERAVSDLRRTGALCEAWGVLNPAFVWWRSSAAASLTALGERDEALRLALDELELARRWGTSRPVGTALRAVGNAQPGEAGVRALREAVTTLERAPGRLELAEARVDLGSALRRMGQRREAREHLRQGLDLAHHHGGLALADRAREELVIAGGRPRRDALRGPDALTPSELRVARMAASGLTNRQIAQSLFVTLRTVELHLTNSYDKLGIGSRTELQRGLSA